MERQIIHTEAAPAAIGPYSQAVQVGDTLYISGQLPIDPATGNLVSHDIKEQTEQALKNLQAILKEAGLNLSHIVSTTVLLDNIGDFQAMNEVYGAHFQAPYPARVAYEVASLPSGALVEIQAIAHK